MYGVDDEDEMSDDDAAAMISGTNTTTVVFRFGSEYQHLALGSDILKTMFEIDKNGEHHLHIVDRFK